MSDEYFCLPSNVLQSLKMIEEQQKRWDITLEPIRRQQAQLDAMLAPARAQVAYLNQITSATYEPILEMANRYQGILDDIVASIPNLDSETTKLIDSLSPTIYESVINDSFPIAPSDEWTEQDYGEFIDQEIENAIGSEVISDIHQNYQETPSDISNDSDPTDVVNKIVEHSDLHSDLTSKEWHARMWIEHTYGAIITLFYATVLKLISSEAFINALINLLELFKND